jgi:hypothetical protein
VSVFKFYGTLSGSHGVLIRIAFVVCLLNGIIYPGFALAFGKVTEAYNPKNKDKVDDIMLEMFGILSIVAGYMWITGYIYSSNCQSKSLPI